MRKYFAILAVLAIASVSASAQKKSSTDTLRVTTSPAMHCENCEKKIKGNIRFVKGVKAIETSVPEQTVTIVYDPSKSSYKDFETAFRKIGYKIGKAEKK